MCYLRVINAIFIGCSLTSNPISNNNDACKAPKNVDCQPICVEKGSNAFFSMLTVGETTNCNVSW